MSNDSTKNLGELGQLVTVNGTTTTFGGVIQATSPPQFDASTNQATTSFVQKALGNRSAVTYAGTRTLTAADIGSLCGINATGTVITLPIGSTLAAGSSIDFWNGTTTGTGTIQRQGSDQIYFSGNTSTSFSLNGGESVTLLWSGASWYAISGTASLAAASSSFGASLAASGYQRMPSGLIMQWGSVATVSGGSAAVTFPLTFPTAVYSVNVTATDSAPNTRIVAANLVTTSGFSVTQNSQPTSTAYWTAFGK